MKSMTGYGKAKISQSGIDVEFEMKSINGRYLDIRTYLPRELSFYEYELRASITSLVSRGTLEVRVNYSDHRDPRLQLNASKLLKYYEIVQKARDQLKLRDEIKLEFLLNEPGVIESINNLDEDQELKAILGKALKLALMNLVSSLEEEAKHMMITLTESMQLLSTALETVQKLVQPYKQELFKSMQTRMTELLQTPREENLDQRLAQEMAIYIDRYDIQEEITRLRSHITTFLNTLQRSDDIGKSLNFILQEMQREANTLGSKFSTANAFTHILVIKEEIEKCREIVQNVA